MKRYLIILAAVLLAAASCEKAPLEAPEGGIHMRFRISDIDSKAYLTDGYKICWEAGKDEVSIFSKTDNNRFTATSGGDGTFWLEGTIATASTAYYALYPYDAFATNSTGFITTVIPVGQKAIPNQFSNIVAVGYSKGTEFKFKNCVTLVELNLQTDGVKTISFRGNNDELIAGTLRINIPSKDEDAPVTTVISGEKEVTISDGGSVLAKGKYYLAIIPHTFSKGVTVTLEGDGGVARKYTTNPVTANRSKRLATGELNLSLVPKDQSFSFTFDDGNQYGVVYPGEKRTIIYSYSGHNSIAYAVKSAGYTAEYFDGAGNPVDASAWLGAGVYGSEGTLDLKPTAVSGGSSDNNARLQETAERGSESNPVNLATDTPLPGTNLSGTNTANCYVVRAPGWYSIPLVYGNAIKGGAANTVAYAPTATTAAMLSPFVDAYGNGISSPYINGSADIAVNARIEWQDALGLIADEVVLEKHGGAGDKIVFHIPQETVREGNAVISATDANGVVVWSWHIWVTGADDATLSPVSVTNKNSEDYALMRINLGWVEPYDALSYESRSTTIKLTEHGSGKVIEFTLLQMGETLPANQNGYCTFWQWGRKDPFVASDGTETTDARGDFRKKVWYTTERRDTIGTRAALLDNYIPAFISHPATYNSTSAGDKKYYNTWNANQGKSITTGPIVKTIYDPCPAGYSLPPIAAFTGFTTANASGTFGWGWIFWTKPDKTGDTIYFPATGSMSTSNNTSTSVYGSLRNIGTQCSYWTGNAKDLSSGYYFSGSAASVSTAFGANRQYVYPIRPAAEQ